MREELLADESRSHLSGTDVEHLGINQVTQFALQAALAALWKEWGIQPDAVVGHRFGEAATACVAGSGELSDALRVFAKGGTAFPASSTQIAPTWKLTGQQTSNGICWPPLLCSSAGGPAATRLRS